MHILSDDRIVRLHPELARAGDTSASHLHEEEIVGVTTSSDRIQRKVENVRRVVGIGHTVLRLVVRQLAVHPHQAEGAPGQTQSVFSQESLLRSQTFRLDAHFPHMICGRIGSVERTSATPLECWRHFVRLGQPCPG